MTLKTYTPNTKVRVLPNYYDGEHGLIGAIGFVEKDVGIYVEVRIGRKVYLFNKLEVEEV